MPLVSSTTYPQALNLKYTTTRKLPEGQQPCLKQLQSWEGGGLGFMLCGGGLEHIKTYSNTG